MVYASTRRNNGERFFDYWLRLNNFKFLCFLVVISCQSIVISCYFKAICYPPLTNIYFKIKSYLKVVIVILIINKVTLEIYRTILNIIKLPPKLTKVTLKVLKVTLNGLKVTLFSVFSLRVVFSGSFPYIYIYIMKDSVRSETFVS